MAVWMVIFFDMRGCSSGSYLANSVVKRTAGSATQQQFFLRNNEMDYFRDEIKIPLRNF
jgi:hypothetical protein